MTSKSHITRCATLALAASLALGSTPLLAQEVAAPPPTIVVPDVAPIPAQAPAPTIATPEEVAPPEATAPEETAPVTTRAETPPRSSVTRAPAERPAPVATAPQPAPVAEAAVAEAPPFVAPVEPGPRPGLAPDTRQSDNTLAVVLGIFAALALIVIGFFMLRRREPKRYAVAETDIERPMPAARAELLPEASAAPNVSYGGVLFGAPARSAGGGLSHSGAALALPREMPRTYMEREALMQRMVDAAPDRANPFRSKRARYKRARLILASLDRDFKDTDPWIDLSQYSSNWPELGRRQSVAA